MSINTAMKLLQISSADSDMQSQATVVTFGSAQDTAQDLVIYCGSSAFEVHRTVLSLASPVWNVLLNGSFSESAASSARCSKFLTKITLNDDSEDFLMAAFNIIYSRIEGNGFKAKLKLDAVEGLQIISDKYDIKSIKNHLEEIYAVEKINKLEANREEDRQLLLGLTNQQTNLLRTWHCSRCKLLVCLATVKQECTEWHHTGRYRCGYEHGWSCCSAKLKREEGCKGITHNSHINIFEE